jgi:CheY-like chemotaxis protein
VICDFTYAKRLSNKTMVFGEKRIFALIVEDDRVTQMRHRMLLKRFQCESQVAENGKEAIDLYRSGASFDVVFMDMEMPIMNGLEVCLHKSTY